MRRRARPVEWIACRYVVLARKYRPRNFDDAGRARSTWCRRWPMRCTQQRLHHAYLFTGTRGVGKTTVSRILAKSLNCTGADGSGGITATPCGVCEACRDIDAGRFIDYVELDAASQPRRRRDPRAARPGGLQAGDRPLQGLHDRRSAHAHHDRLQRDAEDAGGAARVPEVRAGDDRSAEGAGDGAVALPAVQPAADGAARRCVEHLQQVLRAEGVASRRRARCGCSRARRAARCAMRCRSPTRRSPTAAARIEEARRARDARRGRPRPRGRAGRGAGAARRRRR